MKPSAESPAASRSRNPLEVFLCLFAEVRGGEGAKALLLMINVFLLLTCYSIIKPVREALILSEVGPEVKSYLAGVMALLLLFLVPAYGALASRVNRIKLITSVILFFVSNLVVFYFLGRSQAPHRGVLFFVWIGIFNLALLAQFWSFANDLYSEEQGKRLFAIVGLGATLGAVVGARIAGLLIKPLGLYVPMLVSAAILLVSLLLFHAIHRLDRRERRTSTTSTAAPEEAPLGGSGGFQLVLGDRYLLLIALLMLVANFVNTNGEYILGKTIKGIADRLAATGQTGGLSGKAFQEQVFGIFYAGFQFWVNVVAAVTQLFLVSRIFKWFGVRIALFFLPVIAVLGYGLMVWAPILTYVRLAKIAENGTDYSLQNTTRHALFLRTSREAKYKAKAAIDTFPQRAGDMLSACLVGLAVLLGQPARQIALINLALIGAWLAIAVGIGRRYRSLPVATEAAAAKA